MNQPAEKAESSLRDDAVIPVLLIEDDEDDYFLTREYFDDFDGPQRYRLHWIGTFEEGLKSLCSGDYAICLLDYRLGAEDGVQLLRQAEERGCTTPVIMLTGAGNGDVDRAAMKHGAVDFLVKSEITAGLLERTLRYSLERHRFAEKQRKLAAENQQLYEQAQKALELRDEMHRIVVHDLKNPLNTIGLALQLMERHVKDGADAEKFSRQLQTQRLCISQMTRLIQDLLDAARIDDGKLLLSRTPLRPTQVVESAILQQEIQARDRSIELLSDVADDLPFVDADMRRIEQVLTNLIANALDFTPEGGSIRISATAEDGAVRFCVRDSGIGIAADKLPHLFDRFWQADDKSTRGTGLGLTICKGIVDAHGGRIWAESTPDEGSTFCFTIPVAES